jgi:hypothetical protein
MADEKESPAFMSALVTEHFALQSVSSSTIGESGSRAAIYLSALSSGLVDTSVQNIVALRRIEVIRRYYASLLPPIAPAYFEPDRTAQGARGVRYRGGSILFTMASMIILVNSVLGERPELT